MIPLSAALGVATVAFGLVLTPGPNMMYLVTRSLTQGRAAGFVSLAGVATGFFVYLAATALGLSLLFAAVPALFITVKVAGAGYLLWLASTTVRGRRTVFAADPTMTTHSPRRLYAMGLTTCLLNPKLALLYGALLPQFVTLHHGPTATQIVQLGLIQIVVATTINGCWVLIAGQAARYLRRSRRSERGVRWATGGLLAFFAIRIGLAHPAS